MSSPGVLISWNVYRAGPATSVHHLQRAGLVVLSFFNTFSGTSVTHLELLSKNNTVKATVHMSLWLTKHHAVKT
jgi:hypothetical protein